MERSNSRSNFTVCGRDLLYPWWSENLSRLDGTIVKFLSFDWAITDAPTAGFDNGRFLPRKIGGAPRPDFASNEFKPIYSWSSHLFTSIWINRHHYYYLIRFSHLNQQRPLMQLLIGIGFGSLTHKGFGGVNKTWSCRLFLEFDGRVVTHHGGSDASKSTLRWHSWMPWK